MTAYLRNPRSRILSQIFKFDFIVKRPETWRMASAIHFYALNLAEAWPRKLILPLRTASLTSGIYLGAIHKSSMLYKFCQFVITHLLMVDICGGIPLLLKFMFSKKATKIDKNLHFVNFSGFLRKYDL